MVNEYAHCHIFKPQAILGIYLHNRQQCVKLGKTRSEWLSVNKGSAQGSLMGPISYNMFANDMMFILDDLR